MNLACTSVRQEIDTIAPYVPGRSIDEIRERYGLDQIIKMASNENPLGVSPLVQESIRRHADMVFRYPREGNPRLAAALATFHKVSPENIVIGNGSDEIIDLLIRLRVTPGKDNIVCCTPCFSIYPLQASICGTEIRREPLNVDFSFNFEALRAKVDQNTRLVFITTPDNPSGYCPSRDALLAFARSLPEQTLLVVDEAYMDFADDELSASLLTSGVYPENTAFLRTFSKSFGLAGLRLGYGILPKELAQYFWRVRLPFSVNILAEEAGLAALADKSFREATLRTVREGRTFLTKELSATGCTVYPSAANFLMFAPPAGSLQAVPLFEKLLQHGIIIRPLKSYGLEHLLRVSIGTHDENRLFLKALRDCIK